MDWIKLYPKMLNDVVIGQLDDHLWRRYIELCLIAGIKGDAQLPKLDLIRWYLRCPWDELKSDLHRLTEVGCLRAEPDERYALIRFNELKTPLSNESWDTIYRRAIMTRDRWTCRYCGEPAEHIDHIIPRVQGGSDSPDNLAASCAKCNLSKGGRTPKEAGMELHNV